MGEAFIGEGALRKCRSAGAKMAQQGVEQADQIVQTDIQNPGRRLSVITLRPAAARPVAMPRTNILQHLCAENPARPEGRRVAARVHCEPASCQGRSTPCPGPW